MAPQNRTVCPRCHGTHIMYHRLPSGQWIQQCHSCFKKWTAPPPAVFQNELMTCLLCGKQLQADPKIESNWTCFELKPDKYYCCPDCLQQNAGSIEERYKLAFAKIAELRGGQI